MPELSRFYGIIIRMYFGDHNPPHFHVEYSGHLAEIDIRTLEIIAGKLPKRAYNLVLEWATEHRTELLENWNLTRNMEPPFKIEPLD